MEQLLRHAYQQLLALVYCERPYGIHSSIIKMIYAFTHAFIADLVFLQFENIESLAEILS